MARVLTNNVSLAYSIESALGVATSTWKRLQPNSFADWGAKIKTVSREPIDANRQRQKGVTVGLDSAVGFAHDLTLEAFIDFAEGFVFSVFKGAPVFKPTAVTATGYTVAAGGDLPADTLIYARGFANAANNGLKLVQALSTTVEIKAAGLVAEAAIPPAQNATVEVCGFQFATGDAQIDASGDFIATAKDLTTIYLTKGQAVHVGDGVAHADYSFANAADYGFARVITTPAAGKLTLDKKATVFAADTGAGKEIRLLFGRFLRNVASDHADFLERSFTFEASFKNLMAGPVDGYEYAKGNYANTMAFNAPIEDKAVVDFGFIGTTTDDPTASRLSGASAPLVPRQTRALSTSTDVPRLRLTEVDETGLTTDFKDFKFTLNNNISGEKVVGQLGPRYMNYGDFLVDIDTTVIFTNDAVLTAIRANRTVTLDFAFRNGDGGLFVDVPSLTLGDGAKDLPANESVNLKTTGMAHQDEDLGYSVSFSIFPYLPAA